DRDITGGDPVEPCATAQSVDGGQHGLGHPAERGCAFLRGFPLVVGGQVWAFVDHPAVLGDLPDVGAGAECAAGAGDDESPDVVVVLGVVVRGAQFGDHGRA